MTIAPPDTLEQLEQAAVRLASLVGYVSLGTVEYLYMPETNTFCFLELNPRLQVEHPTTEMVSNVNLPAAQLQVGMGIPLHRIRDIRVLYGLAPDSTSEIDFKFAKPESRLTQRKPSPKGHVIAVRLTAENPDQGFKPSSGVVHELNFRSNTNVWGYFSVGSTGGVHEFADSQVHITQRLRSYHSYVVLMLFTSVLNHAFVVVLIVPPFPVRPLVLARRESPAGAPQHGRCAQGGVDPVGFPDDGRVPDHAARDGGL